MAMGSMGSVCAMGSMVPPPSLHTQLHSQDRHGRGGETLVISPETVQRSDSYMLGSSAIANSCTNSTTMVLLGGTSGRLALRRGSNSHEN
jgi:hypothetical protein